MALGEWMKKIPELIRKYKYAALILILGILLMVIPWGGEKKQASERLPENNSEKEVSMEEKLETILSNVDGAGMIRVMLTESSGKAYTYQEDTDISEHDGSNNTRLTTVTVSNEDRAQSGLIRRVESEKYRGALIVCQGGDKPQVQLAIKDAVSKVTGLSADRISVLKMK